ncbi:MAG TPA: saccharopine dehydrogenase C-terminal domain-containing protein [Anaerolineae bacterium]|nr:saccharopine dehydrogenase C-terminal domain-containing protein [Anaerolineae bacterium]
MGYRYAVLGAGRQGTACAYDMVRFGEADSVLLADQSLEAAEAAAARINRMLATDKARAARLDVSDQAAVVQALAGIDAFLSAVPYYFNLDIARAAVRAGASMCDLGGNTDLVLEELALDREAQAAGISLIPDCGQVPGMGTSLMVYAMSLLDEPEEVLMWDGGLPQDPRPPFNYLLTFNIAGLTNEYAESPVFLRDGKPTVVPTMTELEEVVFPEPVGRVEAFMTGGGVSTMPWTFEGKLKTLQNKTIRYPGSFAQLRAFYDLGLWRTDPVFVAGQDVVPRELFHALFEPMVRIPGEKDVVVIRIRATGKKAGKPASVTLDLMDLFDEGTGFTAMERTTGWDGAIVAGMMARGQTPRGAKPVELAVPPALFVEELAKRGIRVTTEIAYG